MKKAQTLFIYLIGFELKSQGSYNQIENTNVNVISSQSRFNKQYQTAKNNENMFLGRVLKNEEDINCNLLLNVV